MSGECVAVMVRVIRTRVISANVTMDTQDAFVKVCSVDWVTRGQLNLEIEVTCSEMEVHIHGAGSAQIEVHVIVRRERVHVMS